MRLAKQMATLVLVTFTLTATVAEARDAVLIDHESIIVSGAKSAAAVKRAIVLAAATREWKTISETADTVRMQLDVRGKHLVVIDVRYDAKSYGIKYVSSLNLRYQERDGGRFIHRNYNRWVDNLIRAISLELAKSS
jgi:hypothetical protein